MRIKPLQKVNFNNVDTKMIKEISAKNTLIELCKQNARNCFLDVRNPSELEEYKIEEFTQFIPLPVLEASIFQIYENGYNNKNDKKQYKSLKSYTNIYVICKAGVRSAIACNIIEKSGFAGNLYNISSGIIGLKNVKGD